MEAKRNEMRSKFTVSQKEAQIAVSQKIPQISPLYTKPFALKKKKL